MKVQANTVRPGHVIEHNNKLWVVLKIQIRTPGNLRAFIQVEMRDVRSGNKSNERFATTETVERVRLDELEMSYLYNDGENYVFMNQENYEQVPISPDAIGDQEAYLQEGMVCKFQMYEGKPLGVELPEQVTLEVVEADPVVKGQTASSSYKPAKLSNGVKVMVPPFIESGMRIVVNTAEGEYVERAKD